MLDDVKNKILTKFAQSKNDTGSCEVQIGLISERIRQISLHLKQFPKDQHSRLGLLMLVGKRKTFLNYLKKKDFAHYELTIKGLKEFNYL